MTATALTKVKQELAGKQAAQSARPGAKEVVGLEEDVMSLQRSVGNRATAAMPLVQVHRDNEAAKLTRDYSVLGLARGTDVFVSPALDPSSFIGRYVTSHELAHVMQQERGRHGEGLLTPSMELEREANAYAEAPCSTIVSGVAAPGSVQKADDIPPWFVDNKLIPELQANKEAWKRYVDVPAIAEAMRHHSLIQHAYKSDQEFQQWMKDPSYRPNREPVTPMAVPKREVPIQQAPDLVQTQQQAVTPGSAASAQGYYYENGEPVHGQVILRPSEVLGLQVKPSNDQTQRPDWTTEWNRMTPEQRAKSAYFSKTSPKKRMEDSKRAPPSMFIGEHERALLKASTMFDIVPGAKLGRNIVEFIEGEDILGRKLSRREVSREISKEILLQVVPLLIPEGGLIGEGVGSEAPLIERELGEVAPTVEREAGGLGGLGRETVAELPETKANVPFEWNETPSGISEEAERRSLEFKHSMDVDPSRRPSGFESGRASPVADVQPGRLESLEPTIRKPVGLPGEKTITKSEQLTGIERGKLGPLQDWPSRAMAPDVPELSVQAGHTVSKFSGAQERLAVELTRLNQGTASLERAGQIMTKDAIEIDGLIINRQSALELAQSGKYPSINVEMVEQAPLHPGWAPEPGFTGDIKQRFMREQLNVLKANPKHPFRFLMASYGEML